MKKLILILSLLLPLSMTGQVQMIVSGFDQPPAGFTPGNVDSLFYWYAADNGVLDSIGSPATNFQGVGTWYDLSGNGHHVTQGTNGARPSYRTTGGPNGKPALYFDGSNDFLASAAHWWESDDITVFVVMRFANATRNANETIIRKGETSINDRQFYLQGTNTAASYVIEGAAFRDGGSANFNSYRGSAKAATYKVIVHTSNGSGTISLHENSTSQTYTNSTNGTGNHTIFNSGASPTGIGAANTGVTPVNFLNGYISEIIVYSRALTATERSNIEKYLNNKYKLY